MQTARRIYLYAVSFASLISLVWGVIRMGRFLLTGGATRGSVASLAETLAVILVSLPVFLLHWWLAQSSANQYSEERSSRTRAFFLYGVLLATLIPAVQNGLAIIERSLFSMFGLTQGQALIGGSQSASENLVAILVNGLAAATMVWVLRSDWQTTQKGENYHETHRLYQYLWLVYGLGLVVFGVQQVLYFIATSLLSVGSGAQFLLASGISLLIAGIPVWLVAGERIRLGLSEPSTGPSLQRLVALYILVFFSAAGVLIFGGVVLDVVLRVALGAQLTAVNIVAQAGDPLSVALPLSAVWAYYGRQLRLEMAVQEDRPRRGGLRRLYYYGLAWLGLVATVLSLHLLVGFILEMSGIREILGGLALRNQLSAGLSLLVIGLPLWVYGWLPMQKEVADESEAGDHSRRSVVRRAYLYSVTAVGAAGIMVTAGLLLYQLIRAALGLGARLPTIELLQQIKLVMLFALFLSYHLIVLLRDRRMAERSLAKRHAQYPVLVLTPDAPDESSEHDFATALVNALQRSIPALPVAVHPFSQGAPDETLSAARAVILPSELVARPPEAIRLWLQAFSGPRVVVPTPAAGWHWILGNNKSMNSLAEQTAQLLRRLAEGQELPSPRENSPWLAALYGLGVLAALLILSGLGGAIASIVLR